MFRGREVEKGSPDFSCLRRIRSGKTVQKNFEKAAAKVSGNLSEKVSLLPAQKKTDSWPSEKFYEKDFLFLKEESRVCFSIFYRQKASMSSAREMILSAP